MSIITTQTLINNDKEVIYANNKILAKELSELTGANYWHMLDHLNDGVSFNDLYDYFYSDNQPQGPNDREV